MFLFLEMWKVFFPGGDILVAPAALTQILNEQELLGDGSTRLLSRVCCMFSAEDAGVDVDQLLGSNKSIS